MHPPSGKSQRAPIEQIVISTSTNVKTNRPNLTPTTESYIGELSAMGNNLKF